MKNSFWKVFFQILAKIKMTRNKNRLFGRHFEAKQHLIFFFQNCFFIVHTYMVQISLQNSSGKVFFLGGFHGPPLGTNRSESTLVTSVNLGDGPVREQGNGSGQEGGSFSD